jgi:hypothetical protein
MSKGWILSGFGKLIRFMSRFWFGLVWFGLVLDFPSFEHQFVCATTYMYTRHDLKVHRVPVPSYLLSRVWF